VKRILINKTPGRDKLRNSKYYMKKFISIVTVIVISNSVLSCREVEELSEVTESGKQELVVVKPKKDSAESNKEGNSSNVTNGKEDEGDPQKDKIKW